MKGETSEPWRKLCEQAAAEQDPNRLMELIREINQLLESKEERLTQKHQDEQSAACIASDSKSRCGY
jgi:hypothetical protein